MTLDDVTGVAARPAGRQGPDDPGADGRGGRPRPRECFARLDRACPPHALLVTNSSKGKATSEETVQPVTG